VAAREHNLSHLAAYEAVARHIERSLGELGYPVERQPLDAVQGRIGNLAAEIRGSARTPGTVIVGAHYDSVAGSPGANDNGSGVAATLELARMLRDWTPAHTWRFVLFANEEPPYFKSEAMGSVAYVARLRARGERVVAMYSLETIGYYADEPGSQRYPFPLGLFYPSRGDFLAFVANLGSRDLLHRTIAAFRAHAQFPSEGLAAPALVPGVDWSDHWAFWRAGWPAVMITDTAPYRYPHYHTARDTPDQVDYPRLARVTGGLAATFRALDGRW
jgi:Zn-dependent M28 family amino/carboxypeptidase